MESILQDGLLLTPETLEIPANPNSVRPGRVAEKIIQRRACFTLLSSDDIIQPEGHAQSFGNFAIGLDSERARRLGIVPVFYYYKTDQQSIDGGLSQEILWRLTEIRKLMIAIARVEAMANAAEYEAKELNYLDKFGLILSGEECVAKAIAALSGKEARAALSLLATDRVGAWNMAEWIELILCMFQTADSTGRSRHLEYYRQREWRIIHLFMPDLVYLPLSSSAIASMGGDLKPSAIAARKRVERIGRMAGRNFATDDCHLLKQAAYSAFSDYIDEIVLPQSALHVAESLGLEKWFARTEVQNSYRFARRPIRRPSANWDGQS